MPASSLIRTRLYRARKREGEVVVRLTLHPEGISALRSSGWLGDEAKADEVREALAEFLMAALDAKLARQTR